MKYKRQVIIAISALILSGCSLTNFRKAPQIEATNQSQQFLAVLDSHLVLMNEITQADYQQQQSLYEKVLEVDARIQSARSKFRYALVLLTSGHANTDFGRGYNALKEVLDQPEDLTPHEITLAEVLLNEAENIMILQARNTELSSAVSESQFEKDKNGSNSRERVQQFRKELKEAQDEIDTLEQQLTDARKKLDEIKRIEVLSE